MGEILCSRTVAADKKIAVSRCKSRGKLTVYLTNYRLSVGKIFGNISGVWMMNDIEQEKWILCKLSSPGFGL